MADVAKILYSRTRDWYAGLPWYWKALAVLALAVVALLWILVKLWPDTDSTGNAGNADALVTARTDAELAAAQAEADKVKSIIDAKKAEITKGVEAATTEDIERATRHEAILRAGSMAELDALQKKWGL